MKQSTNKTVIRLNTYYTILAKQSKKALEITDQSVTEGALVQLAGQDGSKNQQWKAVRGIEAGCVKLVNRNSGMVLDVIKAGTENGAWIHQWVDVDAQSQSWIVEANEDGSVKLISKLSGKCLDVVGMSQMDGANVQIWTDTHGDNQKWLLVPVKKETEKTNAKTAGRKSSTKTKAGETKKKSAVEKEAATPEPVSKSQTKVEEKGKKTAAKKDAGTKPSVQAKKENTTPAETNKMKNGKAPKA